MTADDPARGPAATPHDGRRDPEFLRIVSKPYSELGPKDAAWLIGYAETLRVRAEAAEKRCIAQAEQSTEHIKRLAKTLGDRDREIRDLNTRAEAAERALGRIVERYRVAHAEGAVRFARDADRVLDEIGRAAERALAAGTTPTAPGRPGETHDLLCNKATAMYPENVPCTCGAGGRPVEGGER